jgi:hypothetical protein
MVFCVTVVVCVYIWGQIYGTKSYFSKQTWLSRILAYVEPADVRVAWANYQVWGSIVWGFIDSA